MGLFEKRGKRVVVLIVLNLFLASNCWALPYRFDLIEPLDSGNPIPLLDGATSLPLAIRSNEGHLVPGFSPLVPWRNSVLTLRAIQQSLAMVGWTEPFRMKAGNLPLTQHDHEVIAISYLKRIAEQRDHLSIRSGIEHHFRVNTWIVQFTQSDQPKGLSERGAGILKTALILFAVAEQQSQRNADPNSFLRRHTRKLLIDLLLNVDRDVKKIKGSDPAFGDRLIAFIVTRMLSFAYQDGAAMDLALQKQYRLQFLKEIVQEMQARHVLAADQLYAGNWIQRYNSIMDSASKTDNAVSLMGGALVVCMVAELGRAVLMGADEVYPALYLWPYAVPFVFKPIRSTFLQVTKSLQFVRNQIRGREPRAIRSNPLLAGCEAMLIKNTSEITALTIQRLTGR